MTHAPMAVVSEQMRHRLRRLQRLLLLGRWVVGTVQILSYCRYGDADARSIPSPREAKLPNSVRSGYATHPTLLPPTAALLLLCSTTPHPMSDQRLDFSFRLSLFFRRIPQRFFLLFSCPFPLACASLSNRTQCWCAMAGAGLFMREKYCWLVSNG